MLIVSRPILEINWNKIPLKVSGALRSVIVKKKNPGWKFVFYIETFLIALTVPAKLQSCKWNSKETRWSLQGEIIRRWLLSILINFSNDGAPRNFNSRTIFDNCGRKLQFCLQFRDTRYGNGRVTRPTVNGTIKRR